MTLKKAMMLGRIRKSQYFKNEYETETPKGTFSGNAIDCLKWINSTNEMIALCETRQKAIEWFSALPLSTRNALNCQTIDKRNGKMLELYCYQHKGELLCEK